MWVLCSGPKNVVEVEQTEVATGRAYDCPSPEAFPTDIFDCRGPGASTEREFVTYRSEVQGLLEEQNYVRAFDQDPSQAPAEAVFVDDEALLQPRALATPPTRLIADVPNEHADSLTVLGPHGEFVVKAPWDAIPGERLEYFLGPEPEFEVTVPHWGTPGHTISMTTNGTPLRVGVPHGCIPGDKFLVEPPALMVQVPDGADAGDFVYFQGVGLGGVQQWFQASIPSKLRPGRYFAARLPPADQKVIELTGAILEERCSSPL